MYFEKVIKVIDSHTAGTGTRVVISGIPPLKGNTMSAKRKYLEEKFDFVRTALTQQPRGTGMIAVLTEPVSNKADFGLILGNHDSYADMSGHGIIGVITTLIECGMIEVSEPRTKVLFDTQAGTVEGFAQVEDGKIKYAGIKNVPSFFYKSSSIRIPEIGEIPVDIAFGGQFYGMIESSDVGIAVRLENFQRLYNIAISAVKVAQDQIKVQHPIEAYVNRLRGLAIYGEPINAQAKAKNLTVGTEGQYDKSPCGTATCARLGLLYAKGKIKLGEDFVNESIIGTTFTARIIERVRVGEFDAVIIELKGKAYLTASTTVLISPDDPFKYGFMPPQFTMV
jgi:proline racemase